MWVDLVLPSHDPLWRADVARSGLWVGEAWARALGEAGVAALEVWKGPMRRPEWSSLVSFCWPGRRGDRAGGGQGGGGGPAPHPGRFPFPVRLPAPLAAVRAVGAYAPGAGRARFGRPPTWPGPAGGWGPAWTSCWPTCWTPCRKGRPPPSAPARRRPPAVARAPAGVGAPTGARDWLSRRCSCGQAFGAGDRPTWTRRSRPPWARRPGPLPTGLRAPGRASRTRSPTRSRAKKWMAVRVAPVLTADADLDPGLDRPGGGRGDPHQFANAVTVQGLERGHPEDAEVHVQRGTTTLRSRHGRSPTWFGSGRWCRRRRSRPARLSGRRSGRPGAARSSCRSVLQVGTGFLGHRFQDAARPLPGHVQLLDRAHHRDHDLDNRVAAFLDAVGGGLGDRPHLEIYTGPGWPGTAGRPAGRASGWLPSAGVPPAVTARLPRPRSPLALATATRTDMSVMSGRNSCSGGSSSRTVTGRPSIASKMLDRSPRAAWAAACRGPSARSSSARPGSAAPPATLRSPRNMCSVRHRPMPSAPKAGPGGVSGMSALARTTGAGGRRRGSGCRSTAADQSRSRRRRVGVQEPFEVAHQRGGDARDLARGRRRRSCRRWR